MGSGGVVTANSATAVNGIYLTQRNTKDSMAASRCDITKRITANYLFDLVYLHLLFLPGITFH